MGNDLSGSQQKWRTKKFSCTNSGAEEDTDFPLIITSGPGVITTMAVGR